MDQGSVADVGRKVCADGASAFAVGGVRCAPHFSNAGTITINVAMNMLMPMAMTIAFTIIMTCATDAPKVELLNGAMLSHASSGTEPNVVELFVISRSDSDEHPGDVQYLKMLEEERALSKSNRSRHPVRQLRHFIFCIISCVWFGANKSRALRCETAGLVSQIKTEALIGIISTRLQYPFNDRQQPTNSPASKFNRCAVNVELNCMFVTINFRHFERTLCGCEFELLS